MGLDEVQAAYDDALRRVLADITATTVVADSNVVDFTEPELHYSFASRHRISLPAVEDPEEAAVELADRVQGDMLEELWGPPWPECPRHGHPCVPAVADGYAAWVCPDTGVTVARIGSFIPQ